MSTLAELRRELLAYERNTSLRLSPDGLSIGFVRTVDAGQELWLRTADGAEERLAAHHGEMLADLRWATDGTTLLYRATQRGREAWRLLAFRCAGQGQVELADRVSEYWLSVDDPDAVVYCSRGELYRVRLGGQPEQVAQSAGYHRWLVDGSLRPRGGTRFTRSGSLQVLLGEDPGAARVVLEIDVEGVVDLAIAGFGRDGRRLYLLTSHGAKTRRLITIDAASAVVTTVFEDPELDVDSYPIAGEGVWFDPTTGEPDLCAVMDQRLRYRPLGPGPRAALAVLARTPDEPLVLVDRSADDRTWLVVQVRDDGPIRYRLFSPGTGRFREVFVNRPGLSGRRLPRLADFHFVTGDGWKLGGYLMRPLDTNPPLPTVVMVHGGPAGRDLWRFHADAQYLASLGYLSLHVNYRGSKGFGIDFRQAGNGEWGGRMQDDLYEALGAGVAAGLVDPARTAFLGASYGGYASLLAACLRPDLVRCAVAISAPCDLVSFVEKPPVYWQPLSILLQRQVGRAGLEQRSPQHVLTPRCAPVLLAHGTRDPRVPIAEMDRFAARAEEIGVPVRYLRFADEGHHVRSNVNRVRLFAAIKDFLEEHLADR
ncbi:alpha/beta fold hydrolase [Plantactinospora sp. B24E8]|uniref:S9 family peptidase n=1 Tax=Plantactinospora sp. B24E8 TaxID=3153567 RepID=UPI00325F3E5F